MDSLLIWAVTIAVMAAVFIPYLLRFRRDRRTEAARRDEADALGMTRPSGQYPQIHVNSCIGCGSCVTACPEGDVLGVVLGKATIINGARCIGHGHCADECPVGGIVVGLGDVTERDDIPLLDETGQTSVPGLYIAGELSGFALISNAVRQGMSVVEAIARDAVRSEDPGLPDLVIVGAGPCGLSAALRAGELGLRCVVVDQEAAGGTILHYPRRKLVMLQDVHVPGHGPLSAGEYSKEHLLEMWLDIEVRHGLDIRKGERLETVTGDDGAFTVRTAAGEIRTRKVVLALGRRGTPRKLGAPGEDLPKVVYKLVDAATWSDSRLLVVGGGDSAVEAAVALSRQSGNEVALSYRKPRLFRIKQKNQERIDAAIAAGEVRFLGESSVIRIEPDRVVLDVAGEELDLPNDQVFVFAGGIPPFKMLREMGIAFGGEQE